MGKDKPSLAAVDAAVASGQAHEIQMTARAVIMPDGSTVYPGDRDVYLDHARVRLVRGVQVVGDTPPKGLKAALESIRRGAGGLLHLLDNPIVAALVPVSTLARVRQVAAVATLPSEAQLAAVIHEVGSDRLQEVWAAIEQARADDKITDEELAAIIRIAKGGR